jgi:hypothetical protein
MTFLCATLGKTRQPPHSRDNCPSRSQEVITSTAFAAILIFPGGPLRVYFDGGEDGPRDAFRADGSDRRSVMRRSATAFRFGASVFAFFSRARREKKRPPAIGATKEFFALVQTRPEPIILAISEDRRELDRELSELNRTWNHWAFREERKSFEIQRAPLLVAGSSPADEPRARTAVYRRQRSFQRKL